MGKQVYFRYKASNLYENYASYLDFIKTISLTKGDVEEIDEFGYNILHYCAFKSNIGVDVLKYILSINPDMYILSESETLTAFELAFAKNAEEKIDAFIDNRYDYSKTDQLGFSMIDKLEGYIESNPVFYKPLLNKLGLKIKLKTEEKPSKNTELIKVATQSINPTSDIDVNALRLRIEMENKFFEIIKDYIGLDLEDLIVNKSLHELILNSFSLGLISYDQKELFIEAKQVINHYCHYQSSNDYRVEWFLKLKESEKQDYLIRIRTSLESI